jgi:hypothetical protein
LTVSELSSAHRQLELRAPGKRCAEIRSRPLPSRTAPAVLKQLAKLYRRPRVAGGKKGKSSRSRHHRAPDPATTIVGSSSALTWSDDDEAPHDAALQVAKKRRQRPRSFELDSFGIVGRCKYQEKDKIIQVLDEGMGRVWVLPPGNVLHVRTLRIGGRQVSFVCLERPTRRRRSGKALAQTLGRGAPKRLRRDGLVRDATFAQDLLRAWVE